MNSKSIIWIGTIVGGTIGNYIPLLWGDSAFSFASVLLGMIGGLAGIWAGFKISRI